LLQSKTGVFNDEKLHFVIICSCLKGGFRELCLYSHGRKTKQPLKSLWNSVLGAQNGSGSRLAIELPWG
jgi:hypothetical protein